MMLAWTKDLAGNKGGEKYDLGMKLWYTYHLYFIFCYDSLCPFKLY